jgi:hypothetical protein
MPFKPEPVQPDFSSLFTSLSNSKVQVDNYSLYQTIFFLITNVARARDLLVQDLEDINEDLSDIFASTFLTVENETDDFPNSRQLLAGTNITFDDSIAGERTISASGGGTSDHYDAPLTDGDVDETDLIFASGECIIVQVPNP